MTLHFSSHYSPDVYIDLRDDTKFHLSRPHEEIEPERLEEEYRMFFGHGVTGEQINKGDVVALRLADHKVVKADKDDPDRVHVLGVATDSYGVSSQIEFMTCGVFTATQELGSPGLVYLGNNGAVTDSVPVTGVSIEMGYLMDAYTIVIKDRQRYNLV